MPRMKLWQDTAKTIPAVNDGDPVAVIETSDGFELLALTGIRSDSPFTPEGYSAMAALTPEARAEVREYLARKHHIDLTP
jgi:hypothetical protein